MCASIARALAAGVAAGLSATTRTKAHVVTLTKPRTPPLGRVLDASLQIRGLV